MQYVKNLALYLLTFICSSCTSMTYIIDKTKSDKLVSELPTFSKPLKIHVTATERLNGDAIVFGNSYLESCMKKSIKTIPGLVISNVKDADIRMTVYRNGALNMKDMENKIQRVMEGYSQCEVCYYNMQYGVSIESKNSNWAGNITHGTYFVYGDLAQSGVSGALYACDSFASIKSMDEEICRQVLVKVLHEAKKKGCYK